MKRCSGSFLACHSVRPVSFHLPSRLNDPSVTPGVVKASLLANVLFKNFSNRSSRPSVSLVFKPDPSPPPETLWSFPSSHPGGRGLGGRMGPPLDSRGAGWGEREERNPVPWTRRGAGGPEAGGQTDRVGDRAAQRAGEEDWLGASGGSVPPSS